MEPKAGSPAQTSQTDSTKPAVLSLSTSVVSSGDVRRMRRELQSLEDTLQQIRLRTRAPIAKLPRLGRQLEEFASTNRLNMLLPDDRKQAMEFLNETLKHAPILHISFASEASRTFTTQIVQWFRLNIRQDVLLNIGLEPIIAAGCILWTVNKRFDFSLRSRFDAQAYRLGEAIKASREKADQNDKPIDTPVAAPVEESNG
ncbi:MAG: hypothetical protein ABI220_04035 [Candidatus Saccharimonadales bacterium]